jgi:MATE family multidrug resistance protein
LDRLNFKQFSRILFPIILLLALVSITGYMERLFLADFSTEALAGSMNAFFLARIFQSACIAVIIVGQAFVGLYHGANQTKSIGPCVWQLIWFSLLSMVFVIPLGFLAENVLFQNTAIAATASTYFYLLCIFNFLFPLGSALSIFYLGRGLTRTIVILTMGTCLLHIGLDRLLIFGWNFIPPLGATGAALGRVLSQAILCIILLFLFLSRSNRETYGTDLWKFSPKSFWHYIRPGVIRGLGAFPALGDWVLVSRFMSLKSEAHLLVFTIGSTIFYFLTFLGDGLFQTMVTMASNQMGKKDYAKIWNSYYSGLILLSLFAVILVFPFFIFPQTFLKCFSSSAFYSQLATVFNQMNPWLWLSIIAYGLNTTSLGLIVAARDTLFLFWFYCGSWIFSFVPVYLTMNWLHWPADQFWLIVMGTNLTAFATFLWRSSKEKWKVDRWQPVLPASDPNN